MMSEHQTTQEENAFWQLLEEEKDNLLPAARTILSEAGTAAHAANLVHNYSFSWPVEHDEAMERMRVAAADLTDHEHRLLAKIWRAALAAAASVDSEDLDSLAGYRVYAADLHYYYRMASGMIEDILKERTSKKLRKEQAAREPVDHSDVPF